MARRLHQRCERESTDSENDDKPIRNPYVVLREEFDDWAILFDPDTGRGFGLSPTGVSLWELIDGEHTLRALLQKIRHAARNVPEEAPDQIREFVDDLVAQGLAAVEHTMSGPAQRSFFLAEEPTEVKPFPYEPPKLIDLSGKQAAYGATCGPGSHATGTCGAGVSPTTNCSGGTSASSGSCSVTGSSANGNCSVNGSYAAGSCLSNGLTANMACTATGSGH